MDNEFLQQYLDLLIIQYSDSPNAVAEMTVIITLMQTVFDFLNGFIDGFDVDQAWGDRLDILGRWVGIYRTVGDAVPKPFFGWEGDGAPLPKTFGEGAFFDLIRDTGYSDTQLTDTQMRFFIKAKALKNAVSAYLSHATLLDLQSVIQDIFKNEAVMIDNYNMSMTILITDSFSLDDLLLLIRQDLLPKPQAVSLQVVQYTPDETFGFSDNPDAQGFGAGKFAELIFIE